MPVTRVHETIIKSNDLKSIKQEITEAKGGKATLLERINSFTSEVDAATMQSKLIAARTNLKIDHYKNAIRNRLSDMVVDVFENQDGIDPAKSSNYIWDTVLNDEGFKSTDGNAAVIVADSETVIAKPSIVYLTTSEVLGAGSISYECSLDDGASWFAITKEILNTIPQGQPATSPTKLTIKAIINGDARLNGWAYGWK